MCAGEIRHRLDDVKILFRLNIERLVNAKVPMTEHINTATRDSSFGLRPPRRKRTSYMRPSPSATLGIDVLPNKLEGLADELTHFRRVSGYSHNHNPHKLIPHKSVPWRNCRIQ